MQELKQRDSLVKAERLIRFVNASMTNVARASFYNTKNEQRQSLLEAHDLAFKVSRVFYALMMLPDFCNEINKIIISKVLLDESNVPLKQKCWENAIILQALDKMQPNRVFDLACFLAENRVNNSRTRNLMIEYLRRHKSSLSLWAIKYKRQFKKLIRHIHISSDFHEAIKFLTSKEEVRDLLLNHYKKAKAGDEESLYKLPFSVARGFVSKFKLKEQDFLKQYAEKGKLTQKESFQQRRELKDKGIETKLNLFKLDLFQLFIYLANQKELPKNAKRLIEETTKRQIKGISFRFDDIAVILDTSLSMSSEKETLNHPLYKALSLASIIKALSRKYKEYRTNDDNNLIPRLSAQSNYSNALLKALKNKHRYIFIIGDGYENAPFEGITHRLVQIFKEKIDKDDKIKIVHFNPVFAHESKNIRKLSELISTSAIKDEKSFYVSLLLTLSKTNPIDALRKLFLQLLLLQNREASALQPKKIQLLLE